MTPTRAELIATIRSAREVYAARLAQVHDPRAQQQGRLILDRYDQTLRELEAA